MESSKHAVAIVLVTLYLLSSSYIQAQNLTAVRCTGVLPSGRIWSAILYDNDDSIYLFGGADDNDSGRGMDEVVKYSISKDTTEIVGRLPFPYGDYGGSAIMNHFGDIFYLAGVGGKDILKYLLDSRSLVNVSSFAESAGLSATIYIDNDTALLFGGLGNPRSILSLNLNTLVSEQISQLSEEAVNPAAIWVEEENAAYIFYEQTIQKYFISSNRTERVSLNLPIYNYGVAGGPKFGYFIGTADNNNPSDSQLLLFNPETETFAFIPVEGYAPVYIPAVAYVEKLNRLYTFGGVRVTSEGAVFLEEVWYIDLGHLN